MAIVTISGANIRVAKKPSQKIAKAAQPRQIPSNLNSMKKVDMVSFMEASGISYDPEGTRAEYLKTIHAWGKEA